MIYLGTDSLALTPNQEVYRNWYNHFTHSLGQIINNPTEYDERYLIRAILNKKLASSTFSLITSNQITRFIAKLKVRKSDYEEARYVLFNRHCQLMDYRRIPKEDFLEFFDVVKGCFELEHYPLTAPWQPPTVQQELILNRFYKMKFLRAK